MKHLIIFFLIPIIVSCGTNNFTKRKYTKGVYVEKRSHGKVKSSSSFRKRQSLEDVKNPEVAHNQKEDKKTNAQLVIQKEVTISDFDHPLNETLDEDGVVVQEDQNEEEDVILAPFAPSPLPASDIGMDGPLYWVSFACSLLGGGAVLLDFFLTFSSYLSFFLGIPFLTAALVMAIIAVARAFSWDYSIFGKIMSIFTLLFSMALLAACILLIILI